MKKSWFAVKTLYYQEVTGTPRQKDKYYLKSSVTLEERIVLFLTESIDKAIKLAEKEAKEYSKPTYENPLGEKVRTKYTGCYDTFELFDEPDHGVEVFGVIDVFLTRTEMKRALKVKAGIMHGNKEQHLRMRFRHK